ncbi:MAG: hypothetical protein ACLR6J_12275 [Parabacteroides merdae]
MVCGWATVLAGRRFARRSTITFVPATLFGGIILSASGLNWMDPEINPLVPILKSLRLMFHVAVSCCRFYGFSVSVALIAGPIWCDDVRRRKKNKEILKPVSPN